MKTVTIPDNLQFLADGGEMGALIRAKDWSQTPVGEPAAWPQSLRTTLGIMLNSRFPMFLWWGPQLICFYNDAYRPSLGQNGKHPSILGMPAEKAWEEIWDIIKPLTDQVLAGGEATWSEDQLIPIYRNGTIEDVYWTFSYSPVKDESGKPGGVLVTCQETTDKVRVFNEIKEREDQLNFTIDAAELGTWDLNPATRTFIGNDRLKEWFGIAPAEGIPLQAALDGIKEEDKERVAKAIQHALQPASGGHYDIEYAIKRDNDGVRNVLAKGKALFDKDDRAYRFSGILQDITDHAEARKKIEESESKFRNTVQQVPVGIAIFHGPEFIVEMANDTYLQLVGRERSGFVGKPLFDVLPEVREDVEGLLTGVLTTGTPYYGTDYPVTINRYGRKEVAYFSFVYQPYCEDNGKVTGVIVVATDVTGSVIAKHSLAESEKQFRNLVMQSPVPMTILRGKEYIIEMANTAMLERWQRNNADVLGKKMFDVFPEILQQKYPELLQKVFATGKAHGEKESPVYMRHKEGMKRTFLDFEYSPMFDIGGNVSAVFVTVNDVTEKVEARHKVEHAEERLRLATEATGIATWEIDILEKQMQHSPRLAQIFGHDESVNLSYAQILSQIHPDDIVRAEKALERARSTGSYDYEARVIKPDSTVCWIKMQGRIYYVEADQPIKIIGTLRDVTEEKSQQQELQERERKFRLLADSMPQFVWTSDADGNLNYFNRAVFDYSGLTAEQISKDGWLQIVHPDDREENVSQWMDSVTTGKGFLLEHRFRRHDGVYRWQLSRAVPQRDAAGNIEMWVGTSTDIEAQKTFASELERQVKEQTRQLEESHEDLVKSEERYHLMVGEVQDYAILFINRNGIVENWNKGAEKIKGYTADEIIGKSISEFYTQEDKDSNLPEKTLNEAIKTGRAVHEGWRVRKGGRKFWASVVITALRNVHKEIIGFSKVTRDLTERRASEEKIKAHAIQLEEKSRELEKMNAELRSFAYVSSHDLQEPLRKIQTFSSRILEKEAGHLSDKGRDYFGRMQEAANRMQTLIEDLLAYSRTNSSERNFVSASLNKIVGEVKNEMKEVITECHAIIETGADSIIEVIHFQFRQLLQNLIGNALKFARPGVYPVIRIMSEQVKGDALMHPALIPGNTYCHISVSDNGIGFDQQYSQRIFEIFQRLHGKDEYRGTGIGLAIVKKIVENHDGVIKATGKPDEGATFDIYIPVK